MPVHAVLTSLFSGEADAAPQGETEARILDAALAQFSEYGLKRTSMEDVARRAGIGRATLYRRYAQKDDLVRALILREGTRFLDAIRNATAAVEDREEALVAGFALMVMQAGSHPLVRRLLTSEPEAVLPYLTVNAAAMVDLGRSYFRRALAEERARGLVIKGDLDDVAELITRLLHSLLLTPSSWITREDEAQLRRFGRNTLRQFL